MSHPDHDLSHLVALIGAAKAEADRLGAAAGPVREALEEALKEARASQARGGRPDEGVRVDDLTTENDR